MSARRLPLLLLPAALGSAAVAVAAAPPVPAGTKTVATLKGGGGDVAAYHGDVVWTQASGGRYRLMVKRSGKAARAAKVAALGESARVTLGPGADGHVLAIYPRCPATGCALYVYDLETGKERPQGGVDAAGAEVAGAVWRTTAVVVRQRGDTSSIVAYRRGKPARTLRSFTGVTRIDDLDVHGDTVVFATTSHADSDLDGGTTATTIYRGSVTGAVSTYTSATLSDDFSGGRAQSPATDGRGVTYVAATYTLDYDGDGPTDQRYVVAGPKRRRTPVRAAERVALDGDHTYVLLGDDAAPAKVVELP